MAEIDRSFTDMALDDLADAALSKAGDMGASHAEFRLERLRSQTITVRDRELENAIDSATVGLCVRVLVDGSWGFAADLDISPESASKTAARAVEAASVFSSLNSERVELADEPVYQDSWVSGFEINPFDVPDSEKIERLLSLSEKAFSTGKVDRFRGFMNAVQENKYFASLAGSRITQQRIRVASDISVTKVDPNTGKFEDMRSTSPPVGRGYEFITGYDFMGEAEQLPELLEEKMGSRSIEPGRYDLIIHPSALWLTIHESIGHSTELDRVLGYEATMAGTSFATVDKLGKLQVGSKVMNVTGDRIADGGVSTVGYDDEGVKAQSWDIIKDGVLVGYQLNRQMAPKVGLTRSNGCAFADSPFNAPLQRMPNVTMQPSPDDISLDDLIGGVDKGIYIVGNNSWSIDQQRYNFQFSGQQFWEISGGKIKGQLKDVAYQGNTIDFWNAMEAVGGEDTFILFGTFSCGKGLPGQGAPAGHGCPAGLFRGINVLNTQKEGGG